MHELSVLATAGLACRFLLREFGTIVRLTWLPLLAVSIVEYLQVRSEIDSLRSLRGGDAIAYPLSWGMWETLLLIAWALGTGAAAVALHRVILLGGSSQPRRFFHLAFGKHELLFAVLPLALIALWMALLLVLPGPRDLLPLMWGFVSLAVASIAVRLAMIFPVIVVEDRCDFRRAWSLSRGSFWRLAGILTLTLAVPVIALVAIAYANELLQESMRAADDNPIDQFERWLPARLVLSYVSSIVVTALGSAGLSYSYKALAVRRSDERT